MGLGIEISRKREMHLIEENNIYTFINNLNFIDTNIKNDILIIFQENYNKLNHFKDFNDLNYFENFISFNNSNSMFSCLSKRNKILNKQICKLNNELNELKIELNKLNSHLSFYKSQLGQKAICVICHDAPREYANIVCGHLCACAVCAPKLHTKCPICNKYGSFKKIFIP